MAKIENEFEFKALLARLTPYDGAELDVESLKDLMELAARNIQDSKLLLHIIRGFIGAIAIRDADAIDGMLGIKIVEKAKTRSLKEDCLGYILGRVLSDEEHLRIMEQTIAQYPPTPVHHPGYYALYTNTEGRPLHIGRAAENETVVAKWGPDLHVYESPKFLVPLSYGSRIVYFSQLAE